MGPKAKKGHNYDVRVLAHRGGQLAVLSKSGRQVGKGGCGATPFEVQVNWVNHDKSCEKKGAWWVEESKWGTNDLLDPAVLKAVAKSKQRALARAKRGVPEGDPSEQPTAKKKKKGALSAEDREAAGRARGVVNLLAAAQVKVVPKRSKGVPKVPATTDRNVGAQAFAQESKFLESILQCDRLGNFAQKRTPGAGQSIDFVGIIVEQGQPILVAGRPAKQSKGGGAVSKATKPPPVWSSKPHAAVVLPENSALTPSDLLSVLKRLVTELEAP